MQALPLQRHPQAIQLSLSGQLTWYAVGALIAFLLPYLFSSVLDLDNDPYYAIYFTGAVAFLALYSITTRLDIVGLFTRNWRWSLALGVLVAAFLVTGVIQREDSTPHPSGLYFAFTILWRGLLYGVVDALILTAFPVAVAYAVFGAHVDNIGRRLGFAALALVLSLGITATYHLGYEQFREDGVAGPETGNAIISLPAILTTNPLGAVIAHASMHVAADVHAYETDLYLPPQTFVSGEDIRSPEDTVETFLSLILASTPPEPIAGAAQEAAALMTQDAAASLDAAAPSGSLARFVGIQDFPDQGFEVVALTIEGDRAVVKAVLHFSGGDTTRVFTLVREGTDWRVDSVAVAPQTGQLPTEVQLTELNAGSSVAIAQDGTLILALASNPSTGYRWEVTSLPGFLEQQGEPSYVPPGSTQPVLGASGTEVFTFEAVQAGAATLELAYRRSFESGPAERTFSIEVQVQ